MNAQIEELLVKANSLREEEKYAESSRDYTNCLIELINTKDYEGLVHCLGGQSLIYKILARKSNDQIYRNLALAFSKEAFETGENHKESIDKRTLSIAYSSYADALLMDKRPEEALPLFERAYETTTADLSEKGRLKAHIGVVRYLLGQKEEGKVQINEALLDIRTGDMSAYHTRVWESGCLNNLAIIYALENEKEKSIDIINKSLNIASEHGLSIRKREAEVILEKIKTGTVDPDLL